MEIIAVLFLPLQSSAWLMNQSALTAWETTSRQLKGTRGDINLDFFSTFQDRLQLLLHALSWRKFYDRFKLAATDESQSPLPTHFFFLPCIISFLTWNRRGAGQRVLLSLLTPPFSSPPATPRCQSDVCLHQSQLKAAAQHQIDSNISAAKMPISSSPPPS